MAIENRMDHSASPTVRTSHDLVTVKSRTTSLLSDDEDLSRDSGYGSPDMSVGVFSLDTPETRSTKRSFDLTQVRRSLFSFKRSRTESVDDSDDDDNRVCEKRQRLFIDNDVDDGDDEVFLTEVTSDVVKTAVDKMEIDRSLVGDGSQTHCLPTVQGKHKDLKSVSASTVSQLLAGKYEDAISGYQIIDCRYPYEYEGGHIEGALNLFTEALITDLLSNGRGRQSTERNILIFHCEFSSERGPKLLRHLRSLDRKLNSDRYPFLFHPEVYLLDGGYKAFYEQHQDQCQPQTYRPMLHQDYSSVLRHFRSTKSHAVRERKRAFQRRQVLEMSPSTFTL
ncbi:M-phase inducer phosphatase-like [Haliotis asinina]|uniref:M-phase inducer phosphatase-like n=1 Tax=Haliotis asinina TaxID=109174 RepID=UPI003532614E